MAVVSMRVFVPFTQLTDATMISLSSHLDDVTFVDCSLDKWAYPKHFQQRWIEGETFINVEHDLAFGPEAIPSLVNCPHEWCFFDDQWAHPASFGQYARFGLTKLSAELIAAHPDCWDELIARHPDVPDPWNLCDTWLYDYATGRGPYRPHEHRSPILQANPRYYSRLLAGKPQPACDPPSYPRHPYDGEIP